MRKLDRTAAILFIIVSVVFGYMSVEMPGPIGGRGIGPGGFPLAISLGLLVCGLLLLHRATGQKIEEEGKAPPRWPGLRDGRNFYIVLGATIAYPAAIWVFGYVICTLLFISFLVKTLGKYNWKQVAFVSLPSTIFLYYAFKVWFYMPLPTGFLW